MLHQEMLRQEYLDRKIFAPRNIGQRNIAQRNMTPSEQRLAWARMVRMKVSSGWMLIALINDYAMRAMIRVHGNGKFKHNLICNMICERRLDSHLSR